MSNGQAQVFGALPRPGRALKALLIGLLAIWIAFAVGINWAGASSELFLLLCGSTPKILSGEIWRLFTAPLVHLPTGGAGFSHILFSLLGLYFLSPSLEATWGTKRFVQFLVLAGLFGYGLQLVAEVLIPAAGTGKVLGEYWCGAMPLVEAVAIAWAMSFKGREVRLMFVLPVSSTGLIVFVVAISVLRVIAASETLDGLVSPFGGMLAGWLFGGTPSVARRLYLRSRLKRIEREVEVEAKRRRDRVARSGLRVIEGGKDSDDDDGPSSEKRGPDGRWLN